MQIKLDNGFLLDCGNVMAEHIGKDNGILDVDIREYEKMIDKAQENIAKIRNGEVQGHGEPALFMSLPYQPKERITGLIESAEQIKKDFDTVVSIGIGGSYLGNKMLFEALCHPYYNEDERVRGGWPRLLFAGDNLDPVRLHGLLEIIDLEKTKFIVISKSGGTAEPSAAFMVVADALLKVGLRLSDHVIAVTDPEKGALYEIVKANGMEAFQIPHGVGGRFSVLSECGLITAAATGNDIQALLDGAASMDVACRTGDIKKNPALMYALSCTILYKKYSKNIGVMMPYSTSLKSLGEWYVQLLAESLGKEKDRDGNIVHEGRTPVPAVGTTDMHAQTQQHREGSNSRLITMIRIKDFKEKEIELPDQFSDKKKLAYLVGKKLSTALSAALEANALSLSRAGRPNCTIELPELTAFTLGQLIYLFEMATAYEGELLNLNAYDQPGVEDYKKIMAQILK